MILIAVVSAVAIFAAINSPKTLGKAPKYTDDAFKSAELLVGDRFSGENGPFIAESTPFTINGSSNPSCVKFSWTDNPGGSKSYDTAITVVENLKQGDPILILRLETVNSIGNKRRIPIVVQRLPPASPTPESPK